MLDLHDHSAAVAVHVPSVPPGGSGRGGQVRWARKRPAATGATGPPTHSRPAGGIALDGARQAGEPALVDQHGLPGGTDAVVQQVGGRQAGRAAGRDVLHPAGVVPDTALRAVRVEHVDELRSAGAQQPLEVGVADPGPVQARLDRHDQVGQAGADDLHRQPLGAAGRGPGSGRRGRPPQAGRLSTWPSRGTPWSMIVSTQLAAPRVRTSTRRCATARVQLSSAPRPAAAPRGPAAGCAARPRRPAPDVRRNPAPRPR